MFIALVITSIVLAAIAVGSATGKLRKAGAVVAAIHGTVGVPLRFLPVLAALEIAGGIGILIGLAIDPLGIAAATGLVLYFVGAVISHLRVRDTKGAAQPVLPPAVAQIRRHRCRYGSRRVRHADGDLSRPPRPPW
jgi:uncharacterized membrane protein YphA (DoxX/SURF4 family)